MVPTRTSMKTGSPAAPSIDAAEVGWAAEEVAGLLRQIPGDSVVGKVLGQTLRELASLKQCVPGQVVGPFRVKAAA